MIRLFVVAGALLAVTTAASAQGEPPRVSGTVDGAVIPKEVFAVPHSNGVILFAAKNGRQPTTADEAQVQQEIQNAQCDKLRRFLIDAARKKESKRLGIAVTHEDIEAARATLQPSDPVATTKRLARLRPRS